LPDRHLLAHVVIHHERGNERGGREPRRQQQTVRPNGAHVSDQDRHRRTEVPRVTGRPELARSIREPHGRGRNPAPFLGAVDQVVVDDRHRVQELERGGGAHDRVAGVGVVSPTGRAEPPVAERGSDPFPAGVDEPSHLLDQPQGPGVQSLHPIAARVEERRQSVVDARAEIRRHARQYRKAAPTAASKNRRTRFHPAIPRTTGV
jgi:hypothetical protein